MTPDELDAWLIDPRRRPLVVGVLNVTPDSFSDGGQFSDVAQAIDHALRLEAEGADILDIGGESTRPYSEPVDANRELDRVLPVIEAVCRQSQVPISVDTSKAAVARAAIRAGAEVINDVTGLTGDSEMLAVARDLRAGVCAMHMRGTPQTMQQNARYENVTSEVLDFFIAKTNELKNAGIIDVIIDPGFGFGKTIDHNFELLKNLSVFKIPAKPVMVGVSRKSTIYKTLGITADDALNGTTVLNTIALMNGASILRVHDVKEAKEAVTLFSAMNK